MARSGRSKRVNIAYKPLPSQKRFHGSPAAFKGFSGPVGSGKSQALCQEAVRMAYMNPGCLGLIGAPTYTMIRDVTRPALLDILARNQISYTFNKSENQVTLTDTKSQIIFRTMNNAERLRGTNLAWFGVDELTFSTQKSWERLEARLRDPYAKRRCGFAVWTPNGFDWVYRKFISEPVPSYHVTLAKPFENTHLLDGTPDYYERLKQSYDEDFFKQEVLGQYLSVGRDTVYHQFNRNDHLRPVSVDLTRQLLWSHDFNVTPMSSVVCQVDGNHINVLDEIVVKETTVHDVTNIFVERYGNHPKEIVIYGDATGHSRNHGGDSDFQMIKDDLTRLGLTTASFDTLKKNPAVIQRVRAVNGRLRNQYGDIHMTIDPKCVELIKDFEQMTYFEPNSREIRKQPMRGHISDALGYVVVKLFDHLPQTGPQPRPIM